MKQKKKKKDSKRKVIKDLHLDKPTSHGGWPGGHRGSWNDTTPVNIQISNWLEDMGLLDRPEHAKLSENNLRRIIRKLLIEANNYN